MDFRSYLPSLEAASVISKILLVAVGVLCFKLWETLPPDPKSLIEVEGEIVVIEPNYAHIKFKEKVVKVEYKCLCDKGWKEKQLANNKYLKAKGVKSKNDYKVWVLLLDNKLVFDGALDRGWSRVSLILCGLSLLPCLLIIFFEHRNKKIAKVKWMAIDRELNKIIDEDLSVEDRLNVINQLASSLNTDLIFPFANIGMLNTLPDSMLSALGDSIGRLIIAGDLPVDDPSAQEMLGVLQPATKRAVMSRLEEANVGVDRNSDSFRGSGIVGD